ncbi:hypothetical protein ABZ192_24295 [Streptomyces sp. NPDC006235]
MAVLLATREQAARWARGLLADETLAAADVESTGLDQVKCPHRDLLTT